MGCSKKMIDKKQVCYDCGAGCCQSVKMAINKDEPAGAIFLEKYQDDDLPKGHDLWNSVERNNNWFYSSNGKPCMFFNQENNECSIEDEKPVICKLYPLKWKHQHSLFISLACSLAHHIPLKDIVSWAEPYKDIIADIELYNDFDQNDTEKFIGIRRLETRFGLDVYKGNGA